MAAVYLSEPSRNSFQDDLAAHLLQGYVFSTPSLFMMGRAVNSKATYEEITDPNYSFEREDCNAWWVHAGAVRGTDNDLREACFQNVIADFLRFEPHPLPLIGFERNNRPRFYKREILIRHANRPNPVSDVFLQGWSKSPEAARTSRPSVPL
jgi:hypothetical protein